MNDFKVGDMVVLNTPLRRAGGGLPDGLKRLYGEPLRVVEVNNSQVLTLDLMEHHYGQWDVYSVNCEPVDESALYVCEDWS